MDKSRRGRICCRRNQPDLLQLAGVVADATSTAQPATQNNQAGNNKRNGTGEGYQNDTKKNKPGENYKSIYTVYTDLTDT